VLSERANERKKPIGSKWSPHLNNNLVGWFFDFVKESSVPVLSIFPNPKRVLSHPCLENLKELMVLFDF
jgi:hypothetical protein